MPGRATAARRLRFSSSTSRTSGSSSCRRFTTQIEYARQTLDEVPYGKWREFDPEDTIRFYALRLYEAGMVRSTPQKIIAEGADWRLLNELKRELKA